MEKEITIAELKTKNPNASPRKCTSVLKCLITSKSDIKIIKSKGGDQTKMFFMMLSDEDPTSFIKAVCFDEAMYNTLQALKTYNISGFKLKTSLSPWNSYEVLIDSSTKFTPSSFQFPTESIYFNVDQILRHEADNVGCVNVKAIKVIAIDDVITVGKPPNEKEKRDVILADKTGQISLVLWRNVAKEITFNENDVISIKNAVTSNFNNKVNLSHSSLTTFDVLDEELTVPSKKEDMPTKATFISSMDTAILAIREFQILLKCINCKANINLQDHSKKTDLLVTCQSCNTSFMSNTANITNECLLKLANDQWYKATTAVSNTTR